MDVPFEVIYEDAHLLAVYKPAGLVCHPTKGDEYSSLISRARLYLQRGAQDEGHSGGDYPPTLQKPFLVHRLDRETSGLVLIAKDAAAARELGKLWETRAVNKEYLAIVHGHLPDEHGIIDLPLGKDEESPVVIKDRVRAGGQPAQTEFWVEKRFWAAVDESAQPNGVACPTMPFSLVRLKPLTGRKHQLRIHLAHLGHSIVGDKLYGGDPDLYLSLVQGRLTDEQRRRLILPQHALHAGRLHFKWRDHEYDFRAEPEADFAKLAGF